MANKITDEFWAKQYERTAKEPSSWQSSAYQCICAANVLYKRCSVFLEHLISDDDDEDDSPYNYPDISIIMMLYGLALENLLKGLWVIQGLSATENGKLSRKIKTHNLQNLFQNVDITITLEERRWLIQLEKIIKSGKYPVGCEASKVNDDRGGCEKHIDMTWTLIVRVDSALRAAEPDRTWEAIDLRSHCVC